MSGYKTVHYCEEAGIAHTVLHNTDTGGVITTDVPIPMVPYIGHPDVKTKPKTGNR